jgi:flagellar basal-body rod modification protein FlgD
LAEIALRRGIAWRTPGNSCRDENATTQDLSERQLHKRRLAESSPVAADAGDYLAQKNCLKSLRRPFHSRTEITPPKRSASIPQRACAWTRLEHAMTVSATTSSTTATTAATTAAATAASSLTTSDFMTLLVSELQNQNPLDPTSTTDFVNQLASYANFDSQTTLNTNMSALTTSFNSLMTLNSVNYIGHTVEANGSTGTLQSGEIDYGYSLTSAATDVTLTVSDSSGNTVWTGKGTTTSGDNSFTWDGTKTDGTQLEDGGQYTLSVTATDSTGASVYDSTTVSGTVTSVDFSSSTLQLLIGKTSVSSANVLGVTS